MKKELSRHIIVRQFLFLIHGSLLLTHEAKAMLAMKSPEAEDKYRELNKFLRNAMIKDPTDLSAVSYRIQAYIDVKEYDEAESLCNLLSKEAREPLLETINKEKGNK